MPNSPSGSEKRRGRPPTNPGMTEDEKKKYKRERNRTNQTNFRLRRETEAAGLIKKEADLSMENSALRFQLADQNVSISRRSQFNGELDRRMELLLAELGRPYTYGEVFQKTWTDNRDIVMFNDSINE